MVAEEGTAMADKQGGGGTKVLGAVAAFAASYGTRKLLTLGWRKVTGKEPPSDPHDPQVGIGEALSWAILIGAGIETARLLAVRMATRKTRQLAATSNKS
jgi:Protein of unknown function (DUF4235)